MVNTGWYNSLCKSAVKWFFFVFLWHKKANVVLMISVWGAGSLVGSRRVCHILPEGNLLPCTQKHTHASHRFPLAARQESVFICPLDWWSRRGRVSGRGRSLDQGRVLHHTHTHTHISSLLLKHFFFVLSVSVTAETEDTGSVDMHTERHDIRSSADTYNVMA